MIYVIIGGLWLSCALESLIHYLNFRFWNRADNITKTIDILGISQTSWAKTAYYQKKQYYFDEVSRLIITVAITALIIGQGFPWLETFALRLSHEENSSLFLISLWFFLPIHCMMMMVDVIKGRLKETWVEPPATEDNQSSNLLSNTVAFSLSVVVSALIAACGSYIIGSYENWGLILVGFFGAVTIFANWIVPLLDMHIINKKHYITLAKHSETLSQEVEAFVKKHHLKMPNLWVDLSTTATQKIGARTQGFFHANKIVFTQRAIAEYSAKELLTVLAHEMGHDSLHHRVWYFILIMLAIVPVIGLLPYFAHPALASAFGFDQPTAYITVLMFGIFGAIIQKHIMTPLTNYPKRIFEYQADAYAIQTTQDVEVMSQSLVHTFDNNQGLPFLHPWYSLWYKCHPSLVERITHIKRVVCQP